MIRIRAGGITVFVSGDNAKEIDFIIQLMAKRFRIISLCTVGEEKP